MAYTIRKIKNQSGFVYLAIIKDRLGKQIISKTFHRKTEAKVWAARIDADRDAIAAYGNKGAKMPFARLVDEYMQQWHGKDQVHQQQRALYWVNQFGTYHLEEVDADKIRAKLKALQAGKCLVGNGRGKTAWHTKTINKTRSNATVNRYRTTLSAILRIPVKVATQSTGMLPPKPVKVATPSERSDAGGLFLLYLVSCRQICLLFSE